MAKAFLASIPLALVLVAAVIVPVAITPGSFGFNQWPEPAQELAEEAPLVVEVADQPAVSPPSRAPKTRAEEPRLVAAAPKKERNTERPVATPAPVTPVQRPAGRELAQAPAPAPEPQPEPAAPPVRESAPPTPVAEEPPLRHAREAAEEADPDCDPKALAWKPGKPVLGHRSEDR